MSTKKENREHWRKVHDTALEALIYELEELRDRVAALEWASAPIEAIRQEERLACASVAHSFWLEWDDSRNMQCAQQIESAILARGDKSA